MTVSSTIAVVGSTVNVLLRAGQNWKIGRWRRNRHVGSSANSIFHRHVRGAAAISKFLARAGFLTRKFELSITDLDFPAILALSRLTQDTKHLVFPATHIFGPRCLITVVTMMQRAPPSFLSLDI